jgi:hypothetical protein
MKLFIATNSAGPAASAATAVERDRITGYLEGRGWHVWHWFEDIWLVKTDADVDPDKLLDALVEAIGTKRSLFVQVVPDPTNYQIMGSRSSFPWMDTHWRRRG